MPCTTRGGGLEGAELCAPMMVLYITSGGGMYNWQRRELRMPRTARWVGPR